MGEKRVALSAEAAAYLKKKKIDTISVDTPREACCGVPDLAAPGVSKGKPKKDESVYKKTTVDGVVVYYPYYTKVEGDTIFIDCERFLGFSQLFVSNAVIDF